MAGDAAGVTWALFEENRLDLGFEKVEVKGYGLAGGRSNRLLAQQAEKESQAKECHCCEASSCVEVQFEMPVFLRAKAITEA